MTTTVEPQVIDSFTGRWRPLSMFSVAQIRVPDHRGDLVCPTGEHAFHVLKTDDYDTRQWIAAAPTAGEAKSRGTNRTRTQLRAHWDVFGRYKAMHWVLQQKFLTDPDRGRVLLDTGRAVLIEGNTWHDNTWGDCRCGNRDGRHPQCEQTGHNLLGWMLMELRSTEVAPWLGG
jgi:ribA/ribD-fused uncharacterized protein